MTRYSLLNDALARGQLAGSRCAAAGFPRMVPASLYARYLGSHARDPQMCEQFRSGFAIGYDTAPHRTGADEGASLLDIFSDDSDALAKSAKATSKDADAMVKAAKAAQAAQDASNSDPSPGADRPYVPTPSGPVPSYGTKPGSTPTYSPPKPTAPKPMALPPPPVKALPMGPAPAKAGLFGLSRNATIALGVGGAVAIAGGIYFGTKKE